MAAVDVQAPPPEPAPAVPDYVLDPNAVLKDQSPSWRYGRAPDYSKTRTYWQQTKSKDHVTGSLESIVENLVKNWEVEASFKTKLSDWRTIDHENYSFAMNGGPAQTGEHMLKVGTYNAIIAPNEYYSPANSDFSSSHKTFKRMMPTFAWEVLEVYSGPPKVAFKWRHWGVMKNDYVGFNDKGEKVTAKAHGGTLDVQGVTVALVDDKLRVQKLETWFDSMDMFRQIAPQGIVNKSAVGVDDKVEGDEAEEHEHAEPEQKELAAKSAEIEAGGVLQAEHPEAERAASANPYAPDTKTPAPETTSADNATTPAATNGEQPTSAPSIYTSAVTGNMEPTPPSDSYANATRNFVDEHLEKSSAEVHPFPHDAEDKIAPAQGEAVLANRDSAEARATYEEMSRVTPAECPFMNRE